MMKTVFLALISLIVVLGPVSASAMKLSIDSLITGNSEDRIYTVLNKPMHNKEIMSLSTSCNGKYFVSTSLDRTCKVWRTSDGKLLRSFRVEMDRELLGIMHTAAVSDDGETVAALHLLPIKFKALIYLFSTKTGKQIGSVRLRLLGLKQFNNLDASKCAFSPDGKILAVSFGRIAYFIDLKTRRVKKVGSLTSIIEDLNYSRTGDLLVYSKKEYKIFGPDFVEKKDGALKLSFHRVILSSDGSRIACLPKSSSKFIRILDSRDGREIEKVKTEKIYRRWISWAPSGNELIVYGFKDGSLYVLNSSDGYALQKMNVNLLDEKKTRMVLIFTEVQLLVETAI